MSGCSCEWVLSLTCEKEIEGLNRAFLGVLHQMLPHCVFELYKGRYVEGDSAVLLGAIGPDGEFLNRREWKQDNTNAELRRARSDLQQSFDLPVCSKNGVISTIKVYTDQVDFSDSQLAELIAVYSDIFDHINNATIDKLTGLLNRQTFEIEAQKLDEEFLRNRESRRATDSCLGVAVSIIDIDFFKRINDTYGHVYGDEVLLLFSRLMKKWFRSGDLIFRYGGEEFVVLMRDVDADSTRKILERFRVQLHEFSFPQVGKVTASIGYTIKNSEESVNSLLEKADAALYYVKHHGRNQVVSYEDLVEAEVILDVKQSINTQSIELF